MIAFVCADLVLHSGDNLQKRDLANLQLAWGLRGLV